jgi:subtilisin family serine protease
VDRQSLKYIVVLKDSVHSDAVWGLSRQIIEANKTAIPSLSLKEGTRAVTGEPDASERDHAVFRYALKGFAVRLNAGDNENMVLLERHPDVAFVAEDRPVRLHAQLFQPNMERVRARRNGMTVINDTYDVNMGVDIAILDTGIDPSHPDLNVHRSVSFVVAAPTALDPHGHGTHVAGIAAAIDDDMGVHGVSPGARLWAVKVVNQLGLADISDLLSGLDYVMAHADEIDVVNMSLGGPGIGDDGNCGATAGDPLHGAICSVVDAGVVVVVSAGNYEPYGRDASLISPASYDEVITVSAVVETDGLGPAAGQGPGTVFGADNAFARTFSNYGWDVDIAAPGVDVVSTWPGGGYSAQTGTSVAAPHVAGAAAVWIARHGKPHGRQAVFHVRDELVRLAFPQFGPDEGFSGDKETFAEPLLNVAALEPGVFDQIEPELRSDKLVYEYGLDQEAVIWAHLRDENGSPMDGLPSNGFLAYLRGQQIDAQFRSQGEGAYALTLNIEDVLPGDHDFTALIKNVSGFERSAGCRIVIRNPAPRLFIHEFSFAWPVMNADFFSSANPLHASVMDERGAPVVAFPGAFETIFSGGGPELVWSPAAPDFSTGVIPSVTYGSYVTEVADANSLPPDTYHVDLAVNQGELSDSARASFDVADHDPALTVDLTVNLSSCDFTQIISPPALNLNIDVRSEWSTGVAGLLFLVSDPLTLKIDGQVVPGVAFSEDLYNPGTYVAADVDVSGLAHGPHELVVRVTDSRGLTADSNPITIDVIRDAASCSNPLAGAGQTDTDGDGFRDACDNCPTASNRSQRNDFSGGASEVGLGDACKSLATVRVSSDPADNPDFFAIQEAVDRAATSPLVVQIEISPGAGPYSENIVIDRAQSFRILGRDLGSGPPVVEHSGSAGSVFDFRSAGAGPISVHNLVVRGQGIAANQRGISVDPGMSGEFSDLTFESLGYGLHLRGGSHVVERITMDATVGTGLLADDAVLVLRYGVFQGLGQALRILGSSSATEVEHVLLDGNGVGDGITNEAGTLDLRHSTLVDCGVALAGNGGATTIAHSILWNNQSDASGVPCTDIAWSVLGGVDCGGTNRSVDPSFSDPAAGDYRLRVTSPLLDHGPDPSNSSGVPCKDLDGGPRLRDHDGENLSQVDPGAYERENAAITLHEVTGLAWTGRTTMEWDPAPGAVEYHVYRGPLVSLTDSAFGACADDLDADRTDTMLSDTSVPPSGAGFYYRITMEDFSGEESSLGVGTCAEGSNFTPCPYACAAARVHAIPTPLTSSVRHRSKNVRGV